MIIKHWTSLAEALRREGHVLPPEPPPAEQMHTRLAELNNIPPEIALSWLAGIFKLVPLEVGRPACSSQGEDLFRRVAGMCDRDAEPWMPFGHLGPVLICAHYNPAAEGLWGVPPWLVVRVLISPAQYAALADDVWDRLTLTPLPETSPVGSLTPPPSNAGLLTTTNWYLDNFPVPPEEALRLRKAALGFGGKDFRRTVDFPILPRDYGVAFHSLTAKDPVFNADYAPVQSVFPDMLLEKHAVYPLHVAGGRVWLLSSQLKTFAFEDEWLSSGHEGFTFHTVLADRDGIVEAIARNRSRSATPGSVASSGEEDLEFSDNANLVEIDPVEMQRINPSSINASPEQVVHWVLNRALSLRASDLHLEKYFNTARFRARIDGELKVVFSCPEESLSRYISLIKNWSNMGQRRQAAEDSRFAMRIGPRRIDCRVSAIPCRKDLQKITIRFLDKRDGIKELSELNLAERQLDIVTRAMGRDQGMILVTGPTGSGKTTTLYAFLNSINESNINIQTIEDPIEYEIEGINQTQTDPVNQITFAEGLRRLMRADPDVILIGETRDEETAFAAVNAALTGHLVLTTLHANDSLRAISRLIAMGVPPYLLADSLALSQAQRLVRRLCSFCKRPAPITPEIKAVFERNLVPIGSERATVYAKVGCSECLETGYRGRLALMELCPITPEISDLIARNAPQNDMRAIALQHGFRTLYQEGLAQVLEGNTSLEEIACLSYTALG